MKKIISYFSAFALVFALVGAVPAPASAQILPISQINSGDLIRGESFSAVYYYGADGFRYVFPNDRTYFTWYENFDDVKFISDKDLATVQIGGNVTYKPGVKMIKIDTDPKTYAIDKGSVLRWVTSEAAAIELYGANWNQMIDDVPDAFFGNYDSSGASIAGLSDYDPSLITASVEDINDNKDLQPPVIVLLQDFQFSPATFEIEAGRAVKFLNQGNTKHTATANDLSWGTGTLNNGEHFTRYFKEAGTYQFFCSYHPEQMTGTITAN